MTLLAPPERKLRFHGHLVTEAQFYAYQEARTRKFQHLVTQYKRLRGPILNDLDFDNITGDLRSWSLRWLRRVAGRPSVRGQGLGLRVAR